MGLRLIFKHTAQRFWQSLQFNFSSGRWIRVHAQIIFRFMKI